MDNKYIASEQRNKQSFVLISAPLERDLRESRSASFEKNYKMRKGLRTIYGLENQIIDIRYWVFARSYLKLLVEISGGIPIIEVWGRI